MNKVLIVDDNEIKSEFLKNFISLHCVKCEVILCNSHYKALQLLDTRYDFVLVDFFLDDKLTGNIFAGRYQQAWPEALVLIYSSDYIAARESMIGVTRIFSWDAIQTEILIAIGVINPLAKESVVVEHAIDNYNKELCDTLHSFNKDEHAAIRESVVDVKNSFKETSTEIKKAISETRDDNKKIFLAVLGVVFTQLVTAISVVTFIVMVAGKIKL